MRVLPLLLAFALLPAVPAAADECFPAGGQPLPEPEVDDDDFSVSGRGWGHGVGMSQYGARGAAELGCDYRQILGTYYPETTTGTATMPQQARVGLPRPENSVTVTAVDGDLLWEFPDGEQEVQEQGTEEVLEAGFDGQVVVHLNGVTAALSSSPHGYKRGKLEFSGDLTTVVILGVQPYLYGLAEVPQSWPEDTLKAQAVAGRTYLVRRVERIPWEAQSCRCHILDSPLHQHYTGASNEMHGADSERWRAAVDATAGEVVRHEGELIEALYSSSHGGHSVGNHFRWGSDPLPYLAPVDDSRWELASGANPFRVWTEGVSADRLGEIAAVGFATAVEAVDASGPGGRIVDVRIHGTEGEATLTGHQLHARLGLRALPVSLSGAADREDAPPPREEACPADEVPPAGFADTDGNTHEAAIDCIVWWELTQGIGPARYGPALAVTRDQMASFLVRLVGTTDYELPEPADQGFTDIEGNVHAEAINQLAAAGIVLGIAEDTYSPRAAVRRDQMASFLVRTWEEVTGEELIASRTYFTDTAGNVHELSIDKSAEAGFAAGVTETTYEPARDVRRDQMASFLARVLDRLA